MTVQHFNGFTPLPQYPTPEMPDDAYNAAAYATTAAYPVMIAEMSNAAAIVENNANHSTQQANAASNSAQTAADRLVDVQTAANGAFAAANYKGEWSTLSGALNVPATVTHLGRLWYLKLNLANVASQAPALGSTYWGEVSRNDFTVLPCPAGTTNAADRGLYRMTAATSVLLLPAAPWHGMVVAAANVSGTLTPVISRNGKTICGDAEDYVMNVLGWQIVLQYDSVSGDWMRVSGVTAFTVAQPAIGTANNWTAAQNFLGGLNMNGSPVVSRGSNANGEYVQFGNGTQICAVDLTFSSAINVADGSLFLSPAVAAWTFPAAFNAVPKVIGQPTGNGAFAMYPVSDSVTTTTVDGVYLVSSSSRTSATRRVTRMAIGTWK
ncbi:hypothetical protein ACQYWY_21930 [Comamonas sediminis]|uniref:hypothetical protein n=1 Tax=Comamonas sediminis TaxID=1783360 RepID=UPI003D2B2F39